MNRAGAKPQKCFPWQLLGLLALQWGCSLATAQSVTGTAVPGMDHSHLPIAVPADAPRAGLSLSLSRDTLSGFNLVLLVHHYQLEPPPVAATSMQQLMAPTLDQDTGFVEGHAHLYVNGIKVQRVYGRDIHLPASLFQPGVNQIAVTLNNHGHMYWTQDGRQLIATVFIDPQAAQPVIYRFESFPVPQQGESS